MTNLHFDVLKYTIQELSSNKSEANLTKLFQLLTVPLFEVRMLVQEAIISYSGLSFSKEMLIEFLSEPGSSFNYLLYEVLVDFWDGDKYDCYKFLLSRVSTDTEESNNYVYRALMKLSIPEVLKFFHKELRNTIEHPNPLVIRYLGKSRYALAFLDIFSLLDHDNINVVEAALDALLEFKDEIIIPKIIGLLLSFKNLSIMRKSIEILSSFGTEEIFFALLKCLCISELNDLVVSVLNLHYSEYIQGNSVEEIYKNLHPDLRKDFLVFIFQYIESKMDAIESHELIFFNSILSFICQIDDPIFIKYMAHFLCSENNLIAMKSIGFFSKLCLKKSNAIQLNKYPKIFKDPKSIFSNIEEYYTSLYSAKGSTEDPETEDVLMPQWFAELDNHVKIEFIRLFTFRVYQSNLKIIIRILEFLTNFQSLHVQEYILFQFIRLLLFSEKDNYNDINRIMIVLLHKNNSFIKSKNFYQVIANLSEFQIKKITEYIDYILKENQQNNFGNLKLKKNNILIIFSALIQTKKDWVLKWVIAKYYSIGFSSKDSFEILRIPANLKRKAIIETLAYYINTKKKIESIRIDLIPYIQEITMDFWKPLFYIKTLESINSVKIEDLIMNYFSSEISTQELIAILISCYDYSKEEILSIIEKLKEEEINKNLISSEKIRTLMNYLFDTKQAYVEDIII